jgi:TolA-binding protein
MSLRARLAGTVAAAVAALLAVPVVLSQTDAPTIKDLGNRPVKVPKPAKAPQRPAQGQGQAHAPGQSQGNASRAMENYKRFLELQRSDPKLRAEALRRLGDLNLDADEVERLTTEVATGDPQGSEAVQLYTTLLQVYPEYARNDQVLYQLARAYDTTGHPEQALATLDRIVKRYPNTPQIDEVQFRRGELLFSAKRYADAEGAYGAVLKLGRASSFYEQSLYKHGWSLFKQSMFEESLPSFEGVLDRKLIYAPGKSWSPEQLKRADRELVEDTLRVMSITFSYGEGAGTLNGLLAKGDRPYSYLLYSSLGDLYVSKQRYQDAAATYRAYVARAPLSDEAPNLEMQAIDAYSKGGFTQLLLDGKHEFVQRYNFGSPFWASRSREKLPRVVNELKVNLKDVATYFHAQAQKNNSIPDFQEAARWYKDYLKSFPKEVDSASMNYLLAEALFESHAYADAAAEYEQTAYGYPGNEKSATAGYAALAAYKKAEEGLNGPQKAQLHAAALDSGLRFAQSFPLHPDSAGVLTRTAEELFATKDVPRALAVAQLILDRKPPADAPKQRIAWTIIGQAHFDQGELIEAEPAFMRARDLAAGDPAMRADLTERLASVVYKQAEARRDAGDYEGAVQQFLRVGKVSPDSKIRATAEYDAAAQLIKDSDWDRAIKVLEAFRREFPSHQLIKDVAKKLAVAYSAASHPGQAALEFERVANTAGEDPAVAREALLQSADLYARSGNYIKASAMLEKFVGSNPGQLSAAEEARAKLADYAIKGGNDRERDRWYQELVRADAQGGAQRTERTRYLAARAQLALAAPARDAFRAVRLTVPLKTSIVAKRKALEGAMNAYKAAGNYQVAEVTTAATFEIAELYRQLAKDVMASDRPSALKGDALAEYNSLLEEQVFPFEEEAIKAHEINAARAKDGVYDDWVKKSFAALAELKPARYGKTEAIQDVVTRLD